MKTKLNPKCIYFTPPPPPIGSKQVMGEMPPAVRTTTVPDGLLILAEQHSVAVLEWLALMPYSEKVLDLD